MLKQRALALSSSVVAAESAAFSGKVEVEKNCNSVPKPPKSILPVPPYDHLQIPRGIYFSYRFENGLSLLL